MRAWLNKILGNKKNAAAHSHEESVAPKFTLMAMLKRDRIDAEVAMHFLGDGHVLLFVSSNTPVEPKVMFCIEQALKISQKKVRHIFWTFTERAIGPDAMAVFAKTQVVS